MTTKTYLSGGMSGYPDLNFPAFHRAAAKLRAEGHDVINPAEITTDPDAKWEDCLRADITELVKCSRIALMPGWQKSRGACLEAYIAQALGMEMIYLEQVPG